MQLDFYKYHGAGNDFIIFDNRREIFPHDVSKIKFLCDRRFGIGADGLILLSYHDGYDFEMSYFNSDGKPGTMCGNGGRCTAAFSNLLRIIDKKARFIASDGEHNAEILEVKNHTWNVKISMRDVISYKKTNNDYIINTGSPHYVKFVTKVDAPDVFKEGGNIRYSKAFEPDGINVDFVEINKDHLKVRTYERGVEDETLSCGTGVIASALAYAIKENKTGCVDVFTRGGKLKVFFNNTGDSFSDIWLTGPATLVYKGTIEI